MATVRELVQEFCGLRGLPIPSTLYDSSDTTGLQYRALVNQICREMVIYNWQTQKVRKSNTTIAQEDQGPLSGLFPGFRQLIPATGWNDTRDLPIFGPMGDSSYQVVKGSQLSGPLYQFKIQGDHLLMFPAPPAGESYSFIYRTKYMALSGDGILREVPIADGDSCLLPDNVFLSQLQWRWEKIKGEPFTASFDQAEAIRLSELAATGDQIAVSLSGDGANLTPGLFIPAGSWNLSGGV